MPGFAIICPGQGSQDEARLDWLLERPGAAGMLARLRDSGAMPPPLEEYFDNPSGRAGLMFENEFAQPFIVAWQLMLWDALRETLPEPELFAGYSLGELSACGLAGVFAPEDLLRLAAVRGRLMSGSAREPQAMVAVVGLARGVFEEICGSCGAETAIINAEDHFVAGMAADNADMFAGRCRAAGAGRVVRLPVSVASHTSRMEKAAALFREELRGVIFHTPSAGVISGVNGGKLFGREELISALSSQMCRAIDWRACMESAVSYGCGVFLETGPGSRLSSMIRNMFPGAEARSVSEFHDLRAVSAWVVSALGRRG